MKSAKDPLTPVDVSKKDRVSNRRELRRDLHVFVRYIEDQQVKRAHRNNALSKADSKRLAKLMTDPGAEEEINQKGYSIWVNLIDRMALKLGFVAYDTEGSYAGYSSREPSYPENYIEFRDKKYRSFLKLSLKDQEQLLLDSMVNTYSYDNNEFFEWAKLGRLDPFDTRGCATAIVPTLDFAGIRRFLLRLLAACDRGVWYSTSLLIEYLKSEHPYFLIPEKPGFKDNWRKKEGLYCNFHETKNEYGDRKQISENDPDAFERVEGRFVERFLEGIPLIFRYVDVAYSRKENRDIYPSLNRLKAYRVQERFLRFMNGEVSDPKITVQPNFEVHVESLFYPFNILSRLSLFTEVLAEDNVIILKLNKQKVAEQLAGNEKLDVIGDLRELTGRTLPQNIVAELEDWTGHSENFILFEGFGLLEGDEKHDHDSFTVEEISPQIRIVRSPGTLFKRLEQAELVPLQIIHKNSCLQPPPEKAATVFPKESAGAPRLKEALTLLRQTMIVLHFPGSASLKKFYKAFLDARCVVRADTSNLTLTYDARYEAQAEAILKQLEKEFIVQIEDFAK